MTSNTRSVLVAVLMILGIFGAMAAGTFISDAKSSNEVTLQDLNYLIDQTNVIVNKGCAGTVIDKERGLVLTAFHCVGKFEVQENGVWKLIEIPEAQLVETVYWEGYSDAAHVEYGATVVAFDDKHDLALLDIYDKTFTTDVVPEILSDDFVIQRGEKIYSVGNPRGQWSTLSIGVISFFNRKVITEMLGEEFPVDMFQYSGGINPGSSGGAVYNSKGQLIGVVSAAKAEFMGYAVSNKYIVEFLRNNCYADVIGEENATTKCLQR